MTDLPPVLDQDTVALIERVAQEEKIPANILKAIVRVESGGRTDAVRYEPEWRYFNSPHDWASRFGITPATEGVFQSMSWGLCQVMGATARDLGHTGMLTDLLKPELSLRYGAKLIRSHVERYGEDAESDIIAAYNAGSARKKDTGMYVNQRYVDKVWAALREG